MSPRGGRTAPLAIALLAAVSIATSACGGGAATPSAPVSGSVPSPGAASPGSASPASPVALASPVEGRLTGIDSEGLTRVRGFTLLTGPGTETAFSLGILENGVEFPPGHLAEHMSTSSPIRVFFREEAGTLVVYRIEDAE